MMVDEFRSEHIELIRKAEWLERLMHDYDVPRFREALEKAGWEIDALRSAVHIGILAAAKAANVGNTHGLSIEVIEGRLPEQREDKHDDLTYEQWKAEIERR